MNTKGFTGPRDSLGRFTGNRRTEIVLPEGVAIVVGLITLLVFMYIGYRIGAGI